MIELIVVALYSPVAFVIGSLIYGVIVDRRGVPPKTYFEDRK